MTRFIVLLIILLSTSAIHSQNYDRRADEAQGLKVNTRAPGFSATDQNGDPYQLEKALQQGPVVLIFYRGHWCPVCNRHLGKLEEKLANITDMGASVVAVSPEKTENLKKTQEKTGASYTLLHDEDYKISNAYDVTFLPSAFTRIAYKVALGAEFTKANSDGSSKLPIPATYIINKEGTIIWRHFNPDYTERASVNAIVTALINK